MDAEIDRAVAAFREVFFKGLPVMLAQNETAFLSFMCITAATDALSAYRYDTNNVGDRFKTFVTVYYDPAYTRHAENLYKFRCRVLHNFSPAYFTLSHGRRGQHLKPSAIGDYMLEDVVFFEDMKSAAEKYFAELGASTDLQAKMRARITDIHKGGGIDVSA
jgi:hypothetical protein